MVLVAGAGMLMENPPEPDDDRARRPFRVFSVVGSGVFWVLYLATGVLSLAGKKERGRV